MITYIITPTWDLKTHYTQQLSICVAWDYYETNVA